MKVPENAGRIDAVRARLRVLVEHAPNPLVIEVIGPTLGLSALH